MVTYAGSILYVPTKIILCHLVQYQLVLIESYDVILWQDFMLTTLHPVHRSTKLVMSLYHIITQIVVSD